MYHFIYPSVYMYIHTGNLNEINHLYSWHCAFTIQVLFFNLLMRNLYYITFSLVSYKKNSHYISFPYLEIWRIAILSHLSFIRNFEEIDKIFTSEGIIIEPMTNHKTLFFPNKSTMRLSWCHFGFKWCPY